MLGIGVAPSQVEKSELGGQGPHTIRNIYTEIPFNHTEDPTCSEAGSVG